MTPTSVDMDHEGAVAFLRIRGDVTTASEAVLADAFDRAAEQSRSIVFDFTRLDYMNSGGIGLLVTLLVKARRAGADLFAIGLSEHYRQIMTLTRLDEAIAIHDSEASVLAAAMQPPSPGRAPGAPP